ncbi:MAG: RluA family pseudouridine synthase [Candidatus Izemoplasmatales bacterium]|nr:RluA family pseudouridine synthase [Candidatus Izemoplasmatales bacterium]
MELIYRVKKPETIKRFMTENNIPTSILQKDEKNYKIFVSNEIKSRKDTVKKGDKIHFLLQEEGLNKNIKPESYDLEIVYEDEYLLIINKPEGMLMTVSKSHPQHTLANYIVDYYKNHEINNLVHYVNRIDREASGLVVVAKHRFIKFLLSGKIDNQIEFEYKAVVEGKMEAKDFDICLPIKKQSDSFIREVAEEGGDDCSTKYRVDKEFGKYSLLNISVVGKVPHQIRVHLSFFEHPVVGDKLYNKHEYQVPLLLHCYKTRFIHPITEAELNFSLDLPEYFNKL